MAEGACEVYGALQRDVSASASFELIICGKPPPPPKQRIRRGRGGARIEIKVPPLDPYDRVLTVVRECRSVGKRLAREPGPGVTDETLVKYARFADGAALEPYAPFLNFVPRIVNVVTVRQPPNRPTILPPNRANKPRARAVGRGHADARLWANAAHRPV